MSRMWMQGKQYQELYLKSYRNIITTQFEHITQFLPIIMQLKNGESDCWPITCPPIFCTHPVFLPGSCCPACVKTTPGDCLQRNHSLALQKKSWKFMVSKVIEYIIEYIHNWYHHTTKLTFIWTYCIDANRIRLCAKMTRLISLMSNMVTFIMIYGLE